MGEPAEARRQAPIDPRLLEILVCPLTKGPLEYDREASELISRKAGLAYPVRDGIPIMLPEEARKLDGVMAVATEIRLNKAGARCCTSRSTTARDFRCRRSTCGWRARAPRCRAMGRTRRRPFPASGMWRSSAIEPVGNYAVRLVFDDLHDTGIYSWDYLHELGREQDRRWSAYLAALEARGLSREPAIGQPV